MNPRFDGLSMKLLEAPLWRGLYSRNAFEEKEEGVNLEALLETIWLATRVLRPPSTLTKLCLFISREVWECTQQKEIESKLRNARSID